MLKCVKKIRPCVKLKTIRFRYCLLFIVLWVASRLFVWVLLVICLLSVVGSTYNDVGAWPSARVLVGGSLKTASFETLDLGVLRSISSRSSIFPARLDLNRIPRDSCRFHPAGSPLCHNTHWCLPRAPSSHFSDFLASADRRSRNSQVLTAPEERGGYHSPSAFRTRNNPAFAFASYTESIYW